MSSDESSTPQVLARPRFRRSTASLRSSRSNGNRTSLIVAFVANLFVAAAKLAAGLITGSDALLAEAAHSLADSTNEVMLVSLSVSEARFGQHAGPLQPLQPEPARRPRAVRPRAVDLGPVDITAFTLVADLDSQFLWAAQSGHRPQRTPHIWRTRL
jgi:Cation efflux family